MSTSDFPRALALLRRREGEALHYSAIAELIGINTYREGGRTQRLSSRLYRATAAGSHRLFKTAEGTYGIRPFVITGTHICTTRLLAGAIDMSLTGKLDEGDRLALERVLKRFVAHPSHNIPLSKSQAMQMMSAAIDRLEES